MTVLLPALRPVLRPVLRGPFDPSPGGVSIETLKSLLFGAGQKGGLYVASDDGTNFENSSGTTAISTVEKPVGYWTDRSGNGYHLTQATGTARPVLSARYNFMASRLIQISPLPAL